MPTIAAFNREIEFVVHLLVGKAYEELEKLTDGRRLKAPEIAHAISTYGRTLRLPPQEVYNALDVVMVNGKHPPEWSVRLPLWTQEEEQSDLTLELTVIQHDHGFSIEIDDIHVL